MPDRDVEWSLKANDRASAATNAAAAATERLADKTDKAARKTDELGDQTGQLTRKLMEARAAALGAARAFDQSGDPKILKDFQKINSEAQRLSRVLKALRPEDDSDRKVQSPNGILGKLVSFGRQAGLIAGDAAVD